MSNYYDWKRNSEKYYWIIWLWYEIIFESNLILKIDLWEKDRLKIIWGDKFTHNASMYKLLDYMAFQY